MSEDRPIRPRLPGTEPNDRGAEPDERAPQGVSRRSFLHWTAAAGAGASLAGMLPLFDHTPWLCG